jgi:putative ABC transport system permease protein
MLQIKEIRKEYRTGDLVQQALDGVSLNLRDNEFLAVLGPSGSGKTTLLNVIGGLDRYDSGDLIIDGISTKEYNDRDWDSYRNHTIGFVFQSYNLIPHQSVLANVELALTISGVSATERKSRALQALDEVGLKEQAHKKPNQLSGGQMQRVAIARALVNNPRILLADEPTGALDSETSIQVMELLKQVAKDRLVVMVTHNPELANQYANRIVRLKDGRIVDDSNPYEVTEELPSRHENMGHSAMGFLTALALSIGNLRTKIGRTTLTSFAGSIGIIGIALILAFSTGVNNYITQLQKDTMMSYPVSIQSESIDVNSLVQSSSEATQQTEHADDGNLYSNGSDLQGQASMNLSMSENNLTAFKKYLDDPNSEIQQYIGEGGIVYTYGVSFKAYTYDTDGILVDTDDVYIDQDEQSNGSSVMSSLLGQNSAATNFSQMLPGNGDQLVSDAVMDSYDVVYGAWPTAYNEVVLVVNDNNELSLTTLYSLGYLPAEEYNDLMTQINNQEDVTIPSYTLSYDSLRNKTFYVTPACDQYHLQSDGTYSYIANNGTLLKAIMDSEIKVKVVGIVKAHEDADVTIDGAVGYTKALSDYIISYTDNSDIVKTQKEDPDTNVLTGKSFASEQEETDSLSSYASALGVDDSLTSLYSSFAETSSYENNLSTFGVVDPDSPSGINIYVDTFEDKDGITKCIDDYNATASEDDQIVYTDLVGLLLSSVTKIVNAISYVLIAFVAVSLIVSSIMIGIITYISVLERTKEIGILRALGASKRNISNVFNAETFFVGLFAGVIGVVIAQLLTLPINAILHSLLEEVTISATLPFYDALILIILSVLLTLIGGLIPAKKAAKKDPVIALRTE